MKKYLFALMTGSLAVAANAQDMYKTPYMVKALTADAINHVKAVTNGGNIDVAGVDAEARIEVYIWPGNNKDRKLTAEELKKKLEDEYDLTVTSGNHALTAIARQKRQVRNWNNGLSISFKIFVPHAASTQLNTSGGNISLTALSGAQDFTTSGGNLSIDHLNGHIKGRTSGGNIVCSDMKDDIDLSTSGGDIRAEKMEGSITLTTSGGNLILHTLQGTIKASTSGGNVEANQVAGELSAHTSGGNIDMANLSCSLETSTSGGNIDVKMTALGKYIKISNSGGNTDLQIPQNKGVDLSLSADKVNASALSGFKGDVKKDRVDGTLNGGGIPITVHGGSQINFSVK